MNQQSPNNKPDGSDVPLKRKRGRPRKYPKVDGEEDAYTPINRNKTQSRVSGENAQVAPVFARVNRNQPSRSEPDNNSDDAMVGETVSGVVEARFDAGYLLSVRIGNSDTTLSGLVFKPGRYVPISADNDVAPSVPMIRRNVVPFPIGTYSQTQNPHPKDRDEQHININRNETHTVNGSPSTSQVLKGAVNSSNLTTSQGKNVPSVAEQTTHPLSTGNAVPSVLPPDNLSDVVLVNNEQPQVMTHASQGSVSSVTKAIPAEGSQVPSSQTHPLARGNVVPIVLPPLHNSSNVVPVSNQPPHIMTQVSLGSVSSITKVVPALGNQVPSSQSRTLTQGNMVPLVLPPGNSPNVVTVNKQPPQVMTEASLGSISIVTKEITADGNKVPSSQAQTSHNLLPRAVQNEGSTHDQPSAAMKDAEAKSTILPDRSFEKPVTDIIARVQVPSDSVDTETNKSGGKIPVKDLSNRLEVNEIGQPTTIQTMQPVQAGPEEHSEPLEILNTSKMTELLQVLQENTMLNQEREVEKLGSGQKSIDIRNFDTEHEDGETGQSTKMLEHQVPDL